MGGYGRQLAIPDYQNITFNGFIFTLCSFNITCNGSFVTFGSSLILFSHLMISFSYCAILILHVTILLSHSVVPYFFSSTFDDSIITLYSSNITCNNLLSHSVVYLFFLTFDGSILTLCSSNITCNSYFVTFCGSLIFFSHLTIPFSYCVVPTLHFTILLSH